MLKRILPFLCLGIFCVTGLAQDFPTRPVRIVVPWPPSGNVDITARTIAPAFGDALGQQVIVENRPGGGSTLAARAAATADPDGYTLLLASAASLAIGPALYNNIGYDPATSFAPIAFISSVPYVMIAGPKVAAKTVADLVAYAKANPGKLSYSSAGIGSASHLAAELFRLDAGIEIVHVPNKGMNPALIDLLGGSVQLLFASVPGMQAERAQVRAIAMAERKRSALMPELATMDEQGLKGFEVANWAGLLGPAGLDGAIVKKLHDEIVAILATPDMQERIRTLGYDVIGSTPEEFGAQAVQDVARWSAVVKKAGIATN